MKQVRISIEWNYGHTASMFRYLLNKDKLKLLGSNKVAKIYTVCTILRNIHNGFYGCQASNYFDVKLPENFVECYLTQAPINGDAESEEEDD